MLWPDLDDAKAKASGRVYQPLCRRWPESPFRHAWRKRASRRCSASMGQTSLTLVDVVLLLALAALGSLLVLVLARGGALDALGGLLDEIHGDGGWGEYRVDELGCE